MKNLLLVAILHLLFITSDAQEISSIYENKMDFITEMIQRGGSDKGLSLNSIPEQIDLPEAVKPFNIDEYKKLFLSNHKYFFFKQSEYEEGTIKAFFPNLLFPRSMYSHSLSGYGFNFIEALTADKKVFPIDKEFIAGFNLGTDEISSLTPSKYSIYGTKVKPEIIDRTATLKGNFSIVYVKSYSTLEFSVADIGQSKSTGNTTVTLLELKNDYAKIKVNSLTRAERMLVKGLNQKKQNLVTSNQYNIPELIYNTLDKNGNIIKDKEDELMQMTEPMINWLYSFGRNRSSLPVDPTDAVINSVIRAINVKGKINTLQVYIPELANEQIPFELPKKEIK